MRPISSYHTPNYTLYLSHLLISLAPSEISSILLAGSYHFFSPCSYAPRASTTISHEFLLECRNRCGRALMMGSSLSSSGVSPPMESKCGLWFGKLSMEWWETPPLANMGKNRETELMDSSNHVRLECWMR